MPTTESLRTIGGVSARFFLIQPDGTIRHRDEFNRMTEFAFQRQSTAEKHAGWVGARVWDKVLGRFV